VYPYQQIVYKHVSNTYQTSIAQIGFLAEKYLRYLPREIPEFPSHGSDHSIGVIKIINDFVDKWDAKLSEEEIFLLYLSAWVHDIGCLISREDHQIGSVKLIERHEMFEQLLGLERLTCLKYIVKYHSSNEEITEVPLQWGDIRLRKICSVFRILDASEMSETKCPREVYNVIMSSTRPLNEVANNYWKAHMAIQSLKFNCPEIQIFVDDLKPCNFLIDKLEEEITVVRDVFLKHNITCPHVKRIEIKDDLI
jgi:hypothetical protein